MFATILRRAKASAFIDQGMAKAPTQIQQFPTKAPAHQIFADAFNVFKELGDDRLAEALAFFKFPRLSAASKALVKSGARPVIIAFANYLVGDTGRNWPLMRSKLVTRIQVRPMAFAKSKATPPQMMAMAMERITAAAELLISIYE